MVWCGCLVRPGKAKLVFLNTVTKALRPLRPLRPLTNGWFMLVQCTWRALALAFQGPVASRQLVAVPTSP